MPELLDLPMAEPEPEPVKPLSFARHRLTLELARPAFKPAYPVIIYIPTPGDGLSVSTGQYRMTKTEVWAMVFMGARSSTAANPQPNNTRYFKLSAVDAVGGLTDTGIVVQQFGVISFLAFYLPTDEQIEVFMRDR